MPPCLHQEHATPESNHLHTCQPDSSKNTRAKANRKSPIPAWDEALLAVPPMLPPFRPWHQSRQRKKRPLVLPITGPTGVGYQASQLALHHSTRRWSSHGLPIATFSRRSQFSDGNALCYCSYSTLCHAIILSEWGTPDSASRATISSQHQEYFN